MKNFSAINIHILFNKSEKIISSKIRNCIKNEGLTCSQFMVLDILYKKGELRICELINSISATSGNMTVILKNMEKSGLIYRKVDCRDKRAFLLCITDEGKSLFEKILPKYLSEIENIYSIFNNIEKEQLINLLEKFKQDDNNEYLEDIYYI